MVSLAVYLDEGFIWTLVLLAFAFGFFWLQSLQVRVTELEKRKN